MGTTNYTKGYKSISNLARLREYYDKHVVDGIELKNVIFNETSLSFTTNFNDIFIAGAFNTESIQPLISMGDLRNLSGSLDLAVITDLDSYQGTKYFLSDDAINLSSVDLVNALFGQYEESKFLYRFNDIFYASLDSDTVFGFDGDDVMYGSFERLPSRLNEDDFFVGGAGVDRIIFEEKITDVTIFNTIKDIGTYVPDGGYVIVFAIRDKASLEMMYINSVEFVQFENVTYHIDYVDKELRFLIEGSSGEDWLEANDFSEYIDAGDGLDTVAFDAKYASISKWGAGFKVNDDVLINVERIQFADTHIALDTEGATSAGGIYRLYQATFARTPDKEGYGFWLAAADNGLSAKRMAEDFTMSAEFQNLYGVNKTDPYFTGEDVGAMITGFYNNILGRDPDPSGYDFWVGVVENKIDTVGGVLTGFSESEENYNNTIGTIQNGMQYDLWSG